MLARFSSCKSKMVAPSGASCAFCMHKETTDYHGASDIAVSDQLTEVLVGAWKIRQRHMYARKYFHLGCS